VTRQELVDLLYAEGIDPNAYSLRGGMPDEKLCVERSKGGWAVYYSERGLRSGECWFPTEDEACEDFWHRLARDPTTRLSYKQRPQREQIEGREVIKDWDVPGSGDRIALLKSADKGHDENLVRLTSAGSLVWRARLPETNDYWVACLYEHPNLVANSWSCYQVRIDPETGLWISSTFTK
jgi:hypothetical protein